MTWIPHLNPEFPDASRADSVEMLIVPRARDIGAFEVRRALPTKQRQMVGRSFFLIKWVRPNFSITLTRTSGRIRI